MNTQDEFWHWFIQHEAELFNSDFTREADREAMFNEIAGELQKVDADLTFEFGPNGVPSRELVISAAGIRRAFPAVISLVGAAPRLAKWHVIAFRPRRTPINIVQIAGKRVDPRDVQCSLLDNGKMAGIYLFIPGFRDDDVDFKQIGYLLLDEAIGEYDVVTRLGLIKMLSPQTSTDGERHPLADLPPLFDQLIAQLEKRSQGPN